MMNDSKIDGEFRDGFLAEYASTASFYNNLTINKDKKKFPIESMFKNRAKGIRNLKRFGEMCVATTKNKIQGKLSNKWTVCVFVGYAVNHAVTFTGYWIQKQKASLNQEMACGWIQVMEPRLNQRMIQVLVMIQKVKFTIWKTKGKLKNVLMKLQMTGRANELKGI
jgi:hypothetical protein